MFGKVISALLKANATLLTLVSTNSIFPYIINENTALPAILYQIDSIDPDYDKEGHNGDELEFSVLSFDPNYADLQAIVTQVRAALEFKSGTTAGVTYWSILVTGQSEGYILNEETFVNKLSFRTQIISYS